jgi:hypothetical protein
MSSTQQTLTPIERPRCAVCKTRMMLERVTPGPVGFEHRVFECPKCNHVEAKIIASDPLNSTAQGWLSGELGHSISHEIKDGKLIPKPTK